MYMDRPQSTTMCTVRLHPEGGWTPVLHLSGQVSEVLSDLSSRPE